MAPAPATPTLAQAIRTKYPGVYDDLDDSTLEGKIVAKYPQYADMPRSAAPLDANPQAIVDSHNDSAWNQVKSGASNIASDLGKGVAEGAGQLPAMLSGWLNKIPKVGETLAPSQGVTAFKQMTTPDNTTQRVGAGLEQAGEMALTGGPLKAGAEALATKLPFLGKFAAPAMRVGAEAINTGGSAAAHDQPIGPAAAMGGVGQTLAESLPFLAPMLKKQAAVQYARAINPTTNINKGITQDITPELLNRGVRGSLEGLNAKAGQNIARLNPQLDAGYQQLGTQGPVSNAGTKVISDLEDLKQTYMPDGIVAQPNAVKAIGKVQKIVSQYGPDIDPSSLRRLRQIFEEVPAERGAYAGVDLSTNYALKAQQAAADSIRGILNKTPDIGQLNKEISFWLDVQRVTSKTELRRTGQQGGLLKSLAPLATGVAGAAGFGIHGAAGGFEGASAAALAATAATVVRTPAWRTGSAVLKNNFANALARGDVGQVVTLATRFGIAAQGQTQGTPAANPSQIAAQ